MRKEFKEIIENEFDCLVNDVDFVIKKEGNLETLLKCMEQAFSLTDVVNCVYVVTERDNYGEQLFRGVFANKEQAIEFLAKDGLWESNIHELNEIELD